VLLPVPKLLILLLLLLLVLNLAGGSVEEVGSGVRESRSTGSMVEGVGRWN
jgi:hypothetical protein